MTTEKQNIGKLGEDIAVKYLEKHGYKILDRDWILGGGGVWAPRLSPDAFPLEIVVLWWWAGGTNQVV